LRDPPTSRAWLCSLKAESGWSQQLLQRRSLPKRQGIDGRSGCLLRSGFHKMLCVGRRFQSVLLVRELLLAGTRHLHCSSVTNELAIPGDAPAASHDRRGDRLGLADLGRAAERVAGGGTPPHPAGSLPEASTSQNTSSERGRRAACSHPWSTAFTNSSRSTPPPERGGRSRGPVTAQPPGARNSRLRSRAVRLPTPRLRRPARSPGGHQ
jgi:hypothetical protein